MHGKDDPRAPSAGAPLPRRSFLHAFGAGAAAMGLGLSLPRGARAAGPIADGGLVLMGWDGAGWNNVGPMLDQGLLPNLAALIADGAQVLPLELIGRTNTMTTWTQVFTALTYDQTGVTGNRHGLGNEKPGAPRGTFPQINNWIRAIPYPWTVPFQAHSRGVRTGWITSKVYLSTDKQETALSRIARAADHYLMRTPAAGGSEGYIDDLAQEAVEFVQPGGAYFLFLHVDPDYYGHRYGEASERYREEFVRADAALGRVRAAAPGAHFLVMTDHGFDPGGHNHYDAPDAWAVTTLPVHPDYVLSPGQRAFGTPRDVGTTLLDVYGANLAARRPQIRGKSLLA